MKTVLIEKPFEIAVTDTEMPVPKEGEALLKVLPHIPGFRAMSSVHRLFPFPRMTEI